MSHADPGAGPGRLLLEKVSLVLVLMMKEFRGLHGLVRLIVLTVVFVIVLGIVVGFAGDVFVQLGVPSWTGDVLEGDGPGGVEPLTVELEADVHIGRAPLTVNVTPRVEHAEGQVHYEWFVDMEDEGSEPVSERAGTFQWTFEGMGTHSVALRVADDRGEVDPRRVWFSVVDPFDEGLQAISTANETEGPPPLDVAFEVHAMGGAPPYSYRWSFGDGSTSDRRYPNHTYEVEGEEEFRVTVVVTDSEGNATHEMEHLIQVGEDEGGGIGLSLLDFAYGFCVLVCVIMVPVAFTAAYRKELVRGTVRTLVCYPVGPLDITVSKLAYCFIICLPFTLVAFLVPVQGLGKDGGDYLLIFLVTFLLTVVTMTIGALGALAISRVTGRMWFRPHALAFGAVLLAFIFTTRMMGLVGTLLSMLTGMDADWLASTFAPLIAISPYHLGGELLRAALGASTDVNPVVLVLPVLLLAGAGWLASRAYPSVFEKE